MPVQYLISRLSAKVVTTFPAEVYIFIKAVKASLCKSYMGLAFSFNPLV
jgi:hypothetical protein